VGGAKLSDLVVKKADRGGEMLDRLHLRCA
jgi:hypothetical protein